MRARQPLPRLWLMTDERQGDGLFDAIARLPDGAGIVFRHYSLPESERRALFERVRAARTPGCCCSPARPSRREAWGADGSHGRGRGDGLRSAPAHDLGRDPRRRARRRRPASSSRRSSRPAAIRSATRSARRASPARRGARALPVIALGGMNARARAGSLARRLWLGGDRRLEPSRSGRRCRRRRPGCRGGRRGRAARAGRGRCGSGRRR